MHIIISEVFITCKVFISYMLPPIFVSGLLDSHDVVWSHVLAYAWYHLSDTLIYILRASLAHVSMTSTASSKLPLLLLDEFVVANKTNFRNIFTVITSTIQYTLWTQFECCSNGHAIATLTSS